MNSGCSTPFEDISNSQLAKPTSTLIFSNDSKKIDDQSLENYNIASCSGLKY